MKIEDIHVGDKVRIRQLDDMKKEYGVYRGNIDCRFVFTKEMRTLCGATSIVRGIKKDLIILDSGKSHMYSADMLEPATKEDTIIIQSDGKIVTAGCGKLHGVAKCSPDDKFDLFVGAELALKRLEKEAKKDITVKVENPVKEDFDLGDYVQITDFMLGYSNYNEWINKYVEPEWMKKKFKRGRVPKNGTKGTIVSKGPHEYEKHVIYAVLSGDRLYIMAPEGIKKLEGEF